MQQISENQFSAMTKRSRIRGSGPRRSELPLFHKFEYPLNSDFFEWKHAVLDLVQSLPCSYNDIGGEEYQIAKNCDLRYMFPESYRQVLLQKESKAENQNFEALYSVPKYTQLMKKLEQWFPKAYRSRIAILPVGETLDWHIDADTSVSCRAQICLQGESEFFVNRRGSIESRIIRENEFWFINTGFAHKVVNTGDVTRVNIVLGMDYDNFSEDFRLSN